MPLDPILAMVLEKAPPLVAPEVAHDAAAAREAYRTRSDPAAMAAFAAPVADVADRTISDDGREIPVRIYRPAGDAPSGTFVFYHGGGWVLGDLDSHDLPCRALSNGLNLTVLAVDYRLAPEHPFPAGLADSTAATRWALANADQLGGGDHPVVIGGDSAGANFAAVIAQTLRGSDIAAQLLIYPATDSSKTYASAKQYGDGYFLDSTSMKLFQNSYFSDPALRNDSRVSPLLGDLRGLAPAVIVTAEFDPLKDQGAAYAEALEAAGNRVIFKEFPGLTHGFVNLGPFVPAAQHAIDETIGLLERLLNEPAG
ncbi:alpha/beta hydrolase [Arthrobacter russicus]